MESLKSRPLLGGLTILGYAAICLFIISAHHGLIINDLSSIHTKPAMFTVSYVTSLWAREPNSQQAPPNPHRREVEAALMANIHNPYFDQIVVFLDGVSQQSNCIHFIQDMRDLDVNMGLNELEDHDSIAKVTCVNVEGDQPPYYQMFMNAVSDHVLGDVVVMSNADQAFDYSVAAAHNLNPDVLAVLSTRGFSVNSMPQITSYFYRIVTGIGYLNNSEIGRITGVNMCGNNPYSWDSFIFHKNTLKDRLKEGAFKRQNTDNENVYFYMNEMGAENAALWALEQSFPFKSIWNACDVIHSWDFHLAPKMHKARESSWKKIKGAPYGSVPYPWGGAKPRRRGHPAPSKHPQCIAKRNCFLEGEESDKQQHQRHEQQSHQLNAQPWPTILDTKTITTSPIDTTMNDKLPWNDNQPDSHCDKIFLFMPYFFSGHGQGFQINCYLMAALMASFMDMALVVIEPGHDSNRFDGWSQFGCPADAFQDTTHTKIKEGFPEGLSRLIQHPKWISRGCPVPTCGGTRWYHQWAQLKKQQKKQYWSKGKKYGQPLSFDCQENGRNIKVYPMDGADLRSFWDRMINAQMIDRKTTNTDSHEKAYHWAIRLGASHHEATYFTSLTSAVDISNFIGALVNRNGLLQFQPWIARDVAEYIQNSELATLGNWNSYDAIHVRRGDKLIAEAKKLVLQYWMKRGYKKHNIPHNYIPLEHYLKLGYDGSACSATTMQDGQRHQVNVFIATDDPTTIQKEIEQLPKTETGQTILNECQKADFIFSPASKSINSFHMTPCQNYMGTCKEDNCVKRYERNIAAMADLVILTRAQKFVGEFNSNWGRLVKGFRTVFRPDYDGRLDTGPPVLVQEVVEVFGYGPTFFGY